MKILFNINVPDNNILRKTDHLKKIKAGKDRQDIVFA